MTETIEKKLREVARRKDGTYALRTRHLDEQGRPLFVNRLILEDSPYLLQHAHNPVNWFSWGEEAFAVAAREDRPLFLSIGYSTCHWCHVMEVESFDNVEIARLLNESFVSIKLDREQYPDIDDYYMTGVQLMSGQGGWPMSSFLLPDGRPFYGATYFPPAQFAALLQHIAGLWADRRAELEQSAAGVAGRITQLLQGRQAVRELDMTSLTAAADRLLEREDQGHGGLAGAPKFPQEPLLYYFLDGVLRNRDLQKMAFLDRALTGMACGGIYDQVGGGFHRYSTDARWLVPHFEKMLYNQSQLSLLFLRAWEVTGQRFYLRVLKQTLDYVLREMQLPDGGFYSATDADSEEQEGLYFIWSLSELRKCLLPDEFEMVNRLYAPTAEGNFEGSNILSLSQPLERCLEDQSFDEFETHLDEVLDKLLATRNDRIKPLRDDKLIVAWSAAMVSSLAWAGWRLDEPRYLKAARRAADFIWGKNYQGRQSLRRIYLAGASTVPAQLEDYANLCEALITLFDVTADRSYLDQAAALAYDMLELFWNEESGGFFLGPEHERGPQLTRSLSAADGATLSAYGTAVECLVLLDERRELLSETPENSAADFEACFQQAVTAVSGELEEYPPSHVTLLRSILDRIGGSRRPIRYGAGGHLRIVARRLDRTGRMAGREPLDLVLELTTSAGFHVTTETADAADRVPLVVTTAPEETHWRIDRTSFDRLGADSNGQRTTTVDADQGVAINLRLQRTAKEADALSGSVGVQIQVQLCSDEICLPAETFRFRL